MSYKNKVEKALELIDSTLSGCDATYYENRIESIRELLELEFNLKEVTGMYTFDEAKKLECETWRLPTKSEMRKIYEENHLVHNFWTSTIKWKTKAYCISSRGFQYVFSLKNKRPVVLVIRKADEKTDK